MPERAVCPPVACLRPATPGGAEWGGARRAPGPHPAHALAERPNPSTAASADLRRLHHIPCKRLQVKRTPVAKDAGVAMRKIAVVTIPGQGGKRV